MKCPECVENGLTSKLYGGDCVFTTAMAYQSYYDEDGEYHSHDPNTSTAEYSCTNDHRFSRSWVRPCPNKSCSHGKDAIK